MKESPHERFARRVPMAYRRGLDGDTDGMGSLRGCVSLLTGVLVILALFVFVSPSFAGGAFLFVLALVFFKLADNHSVGIGTRALCAFLTAVCLFGALNLWGFLK